MKATWPNAARAKVHYQLAAFWDVNFCGVRARFYHGNGDPKQVTCERCRKHLTYWVVKRMRNRITLQNGVTGKGTVVDLPSHEPARNPPKQALIPKSLKSKRK